MDSPEFRALQKAELKTLFCPGIPGAGKTILTSIVIDDLTTRFSDDKTVGVAYLYCNFRRHEEQRIEFLLASILRQISQIQRPIPEPVKSLYDKHSRLGTFPSASDISQTISLALGPFSRIFILLDALDECSASNGTRNHLLEAVFKLQQTFSVNLFATSRFIQDITSQFANNPTLEIRAQSEDIKAYAVGRMQHLPAYVRNSQEFQDEIVARIADVVDGM